MPHGWEGFVSAGAAGSGRAQRLNRAARAAAAPGLLIRSLLRWVGAGHGAPPLPRSRGGEGEE